jgi:serine/threonine-protein kinase RsbW
MNAVAPFPAVELLLRADTLEIARASAWLEAACLAHGVPPEEIDRLDLCLNEALANVITHGKAPSPISLHLQVSRHEATLTVADSGAAFDPLVAPQKPAPKALQEATPGGLGLLMIRKFSDAQHYHHSDGQNRLSFAVRWSAA